jgi:hypothetical protein
VAVAMTVLPVIARSEATWRSMDCHATVTASPLAGVAVAMTTS